jgi:hypothetical protein
VGLGQTDAILSRFLIDISGTKVLRVVQISWRNLQLGELNRANPRCNDNTKALWISLLVTRRGHRAVAREYFE